MTEVEKSRGISRRTIARTAAWSVPAVAVVAATPAYAASGTFWDAKISSHCDGTLLAPVHHAGFTITNVGNAVMPTGTQFTLSISGLASANVLQGAGLVNLTAVGLVNIGGAWVQTLQTVSDVQPGGTATYTLPDALLSVQVLTTFTLTVATPEPAGASSSNNTASFGLTNVSLGDLSVITTCTGL